MAAKKKKGRPSLRAAIDSMCKACIYDPKAGGKWREQVKACTADGSGGHVACPLWPVRPK